MNYQNEVVINAPREKVVALFEDPANIAKWQPGFVSMELILGEKGAVGSQYRMLYTMGKRNVEMIETITKNELPSVFSATYKAKNVFNSIENHFEDCGDGTTRYWTENEFKMSGFMKIFGWIMPGAFKKQSQKYLDLFKEFVEKETLSQD